MDFRDINFSFFSYLADWFGLSSGSTADAPGGCDLSGMPISGYK
jgi:hypothetical protein